MNEVKREILEIVAAKEKELKATVERIGDDVRELQKNDRQQDKEIVEMRSLLKTIQCDIAKIYETIKDFGVVHNTVLKLDKDASKTKWAIYGFIIYEMIMKGVVS